MKTGRSQFSIEAKHYGTYLINMGANARLAKHYRTYLLIMDANVREPSIIGYIQNHIL